MIDWSDSICRYFLLVMSPYGATYLLDVVKWFMDLDVTSDVTYLSLSYRSSNPMFSVSKDELLLLSYAQNAYVESELT